MMNSRATTTTTTTTTKKTNENEVLLIDNLTSSSKSNQNSNQLNSNNAVLISTNLIALFEIINRDKLNLESNQTIVEDVEMISNNELTTKESSFSAMTKLEKSDDQTSSESRTNESLTLLTTPPTTTVNLSESNQSVYFMMQSPIDLLAGSNSSLKVKALTTTPSTPSQTGTLIPGAKLLTPLETASLNATLSSVNSSLTGVSSPLSSSSSSVNSSPNTSSKVVKDERRRANHNEVERRRRDNINKWIVELSKVIPDCSNNQSKHGQSKGGILEKTVQYLNDIKFANQQLTEQINKLQLLKEENELLHKQNEIYKKENYYLKSKIGSNELLNLNEKINNDHYLDGSVIVPSASLTLLKEN